MKTLTTLASAAILGFAVAYAPNASAAFTTYTSYSAWVSAVGGASNFVVENFQDTNLIPQISSITTENYSGFTGGIYEGALNDRVGPNEIGPGTVFNFSAPLTAVAAYFDLDPGGAGVGLNVYADGMLVSAFKPTIDPNNLGTSLAGFFGFTSTTPFSTMTILGDAVPGGSQETYRIPDMFVAAVPIPAALPLFLSALVGLGVIGRRKQISSATA